MVKIGIYKYCAENFWERVENGGVCLLPRLPPWRMHGVMLSLLMCQDQGAEEVPALKYPVYNYGS
jgi:hypothetical protein